MEAVLRGYLSCFLVLLCIGLTAQPLVHEEVHHQPIFEVPDVFRVLDVRAEPGDSSLFHIHERDLCYVTISGTKVYLEEQGGEPRTVNLPDGYTNDELTHSQTPFIHRFANVGTSLFHLIALENLTNPKTSGKKKEDFEAFEETLNDNRFRALKKTLQHKARVAYRSHYYSVVILMNDANIKINYKDDTYHRLLDQGDWLVVPPKTTIQLDSDEADAKIVIVQAKH